MPRNSILQNFDMAALKKARANKTNKVDLIGQLRQVAPEIEKLNVGQTAKIHIPDEHQGTSLRKFVMGITAKLSHLTPKGGAWAGRSYRTAADDSGTILYVQRGPNIKPKERKSGRPVGVRNVPKETAPATPPVAAPVVAPASEKKHETPAKGVIKGAAKHRTKKDTPTPAINSGTKVEQDDGALVKENA